MARLSIQTAATVGIMVIAVVGCKEPAPTVTPAPTPTAYAAREVYATLVALEAVDPGRLECLLKKNKRVRIRGQVPNTEYDGVKKVTMRVGSAKDWEADDYFLCEMDPRWPSDQAVIGEIITLNGEYKAILSKAEGFRAVGKTVNPFSYDDRVLLKKCILEH